MNLKKEGFKMNTKIKCFYCGQSPPDADIEKVRHYEPCSECEQRIKDNYILIKITGSPTKKYPDAITRVNDSFYYPTGDFMIVKQNVAEKLPHYKENQKMMCLLDDAYFQKIKARLTKEKIVLKSIIGIYLPQVYDFEDSKQEFLLFTKERFYFKPANQPVSSYAYHKIFFSEDGVGILPGAEKNKVRTYLLQVPSFSRISAMTHVR